MFFAQNCYGSQMLAEAFDRLPIPTEKRLKVTAKFLDVTERTLNDYITGKRNPPHAVAYALWHESDLGRAVTSAHSERSAYLWRSLAKSQESSIDKLKSRIDTLTAEIDQLKRDQQRSRPAPAANESFFERYR